MKNFSICCVFILSIVTPSFSAEDGCLAQFGQNLTKKNPEGIFLLSMEWPKNVNILPGALADFSNVQFLILGRAIASVPEDIGLLTNLKSLCLSVASFAALPTSIKDLESLTTLIIEDANDGAIPAFLGEMEQLCTLDLLRSNSSSLRKAHLVGLKKLKSFRSKSGDFTGGQIAKFIEQLPNDEVSCSPGQSYDEVGDEKNLRKISMDQIFLVIPEELYNLEGLTELNLERFLAPMPSGIANLTNLTKLSVSVKARDHLPSDLAAAKSIKELLIVDVK